MSKSILLAAAALVIGCASQAAAEPAARPAHVPGRTVATAGVDFKDPAAVRAFYARLERAAYTVCDSGWPTQRLGHEDRVCIEDALNRAVRSVDRPLLTALYDTSVQARATR